MGFNFSMDKAAEKSQGAGKPDAENETHFMFLMISESELPYALDFMSERLLPLKALVPGQIPVRGPDNKPMLVSVVRLYSMAKYSQQKDLQEEFRDWHEPLAREREKAMASKITTFTPNQAKLSGIVLP